MDTNKTEIATAGEKVLYDIEHLRKTLGIFEEKFGDMSIARRILDAVLAVVEGLQMLENTKSEDTLATKQTLQHSLLGLLEGVQKAAMSSPNVLSYLAEHKEALKILNETKHEAEGNHGH
jgi:hypothetical protein